MHRSADLRGHRRSLGEELEDVARRWEQRHETEMRQTRTEVDGRVQQYVAALADAKRRVEDKAQHVAELESVCERQRAEIDQLRLDLRTQTRGDELADFFEKKSNELTRELIGTRFALNQLWTAQMDERERAMRKRQVQAKAKRVRLDPASKLAEALSDAVVAEQGDVEAVDPAAPQVLASEATKAQENAKAHANMAASKAGDAVADGDDENEAEDDTKMSDADRKVLAGRTAAPEWMRTVLTRSEIDGLCRAPLGKSFAPSDLFVSAGAGDNDQVCAILSPEPIFAVGVLERILGVALNVACSGGDMAVVQNLLHLGAPESGVIAQEGGGVQGALHVACESGHAEIVAHFIERKVDLDALDGGGATPLALAARSGRVECVRHLMLAGAEPGNLLAEAGIEAETMAVLQDAELRFWNCCARGNKYYASESFAKALTIFDLAFQLSSAPTLALAASDVATIHYNRARSAARCERYLTALEACDAAIELQPDAVKTQRQRCECLVELRDFSTALRQLEAARKTRRLDTREAELLEQARTMDNRNHYETLGVEVFVDPKVVKRAYRKVRRACALLSASLERFLSFCLLFPTDLLFVLFCHSVVLYGDLI